MQKWILSCLCFLSSVFGADFRAEQLIAHVNESIEKAKEGSSKLDPSVLKIEGMSSPLVRHFLNNLCSIPNAVYLEVGCYKGSTLVSALYNNQSIDAIGIDNWSEFDGTRNALNQNLMKFVPQASLQFHEIDAFSVPARQLCHKPVTIYFYDGNHSRLSQKRAFTHFDSVLDDVFIAVIDDWNWEGVRKGTEDAFRELGYSVLFKKQFYTKKNGSTQSWWNGICVAVIQKK